MTYCIGLDVSNESTAVCVIDETGRVEKELSVLSHTDDLVAALSDFLRIGIPMNLVVGAAVIGTIPIFFPF